MHLFKQWKANNWKSDSLMLAFFDTQAFYDTEKCIC